MRKIFMNMMLLAATIMVSSAAKADTELSGTPKVWTVPAVFAADEEVTFYHDVTDIGFESGVDLYFTEPDAVFTVFPTRFSSKDIITLTREYNERSAGELSYKITAGSKVITGTMPGVRDKRQATVNLNKELEGMSVEQITIEVSKENGQTVVETTIPLVTPDAQ